VRVLRRLQPRLYSISSSPLAHSAEVHLTVGAVQYEAAGRKRLGVASTFLAERALSHAGIRIGIHKNTGFRLPSDGNVPVIMVGPGTGIAPFRSFIHERRASGAKGPNWLFFGDQRESSDFLYREELLPLQQEGFLRLSLAWSRDQAEKIYVQNRMLEQAAEVWAWLEKGAHLYVCGDASRMAKDVDAALHRVVELAGNRSAAEAADYVTALKTARRYQRDVY
jgi:sulfite reductase (NADPH) flavoprotein alpha-component